MSVPEEDYNALCEAITRFLQENKLPDAYKAAQCAFALALRTAQYASTEERSKWMYRAEKVLEAAKGIDSKINSGKKTVSVKKASGSANNEKSEEEKPAAVEALLAKRPTERLSDVSGMLEAKDEVRLCVIEPMRKPEKAKKYGLKLGGGILLYGLPGTGKTFFAKAVAGELGLPFYVIKSGDILSKYVGESEKIVKGIFDAAKSNPMSVVYIDETNGILPSRSNENVHEVSKRIAEIILQETDGIESKEENPFLLIGSTNYPDKIDDAALSRFSSCIEVPLPDEETRMFILKKELGMMAIPIEDEALHFLCEKTDGFSCRDLVNLAGHYRKASAKFEIDKFSLDFCRENFRDNHVVSQDVANAIAEFRKRINQNDFAEKKKIIPETPEPETVSPEEAGEAVGAGSCMADPEPSAGNEAPGNEDIGRSGESGGEAPTGDSEVTFKDVKGLEEAKNIVKRALINPVLYPHVYKTLQHIPGSGLLLYGPPGTGKTMFARAIANELKCKFYSVVLEDIRGKNPLQTAEKIHNLFQEARSNPGGSVLFLDDCEEILSRPGNAKAYGVSQFLTELDGLAEDAHAKNVFVIIATNRPWMIDGALLRSGRISAMTYIGLPEIEVRRDIISAALKGLPLAADVDVELLAEYTNGYSCAEIYHSRNGGGICNLARDYAADRWVKRIETDPAAQKEVEPITMADFELALTKIVPCAVKEQERIARNLEFNSLSADNSCENMKGFAYRTRGGNLFSFSLPDAAILKDFVFNSPAIQTVPDYKHFADTIFFCMNESRSDGNIFNAYATVVGQLKKKRYIKGLEDEEDMSRPAILLHDGMCMAYTVIAAAYMAYSTEMVLSEPEKLREVLLEMNRLLCDKDGRFGKTQLGEMVRKFKLFPEEARKLERIKTLASSMIAFVIAHEFGHIIHGDIFNGVDSGVYSRNMERAADQFAADAIKSLEDPDICKFMFLGAALSFVADAALGNADITIAVEDSDSHPATLERFNNLLKNAPCSIEHFNMTESVFRKCMP